MKKLLKITNIFVFELSLSIIFMGNNFAVWT